MSESGTKLTCYKHPERETLLRCNRCERPICAQCAVQTPTGYRCRDCIREQQRRFDTSQPRDYFIGGAIAAVLAFAGSWVMTAVGLLPGFFSLLLAPLVGTAIVSLVRKATQKRRSSKLTTITVLFAGTGAALPLLPEILLSLSLLLVGEYSFLTGLLVGLIWRIAYVGLLCATILSNMKGFSIRRN